jgi:hypothetical protein
MTMIVWRDLAETPWLGVPKGIVARFLPPPGENARSCGPGPFSMADPEAVMKQLEIARYRDIAFERIDAPLLVGRTSDEAVEFQLALGPAGEIFREAGELAERQRDAIAAALKDELARHEMPEGIVMQSSSWMVSARNPS